MATTEVLERAVYEAAVSDQATGPARAVTAAFASMAAGADRVSKAQEELVSSSSRSADALRRRFLDEEKLAAKSEQAQRKLAAVIRDVERARREEGLAEDEATAITARATAEAEKAIRVAQERIARENAQMRALQQASAAAEVATRSEAELSRARAETVAGIMSHARALGDLRSKYDPLFAAQREHLTALREISQLEREGGLSAEKAAAQRAQLTAAYRDEKQELSGLAALDRQREQALREQAKAADEAAQALQRVVASAAAYGRSLGDLRAKYDPLFAAQREYRAALAEIATLEKTGGLTADQAAASRARLTVALREATAEANGSAALQRQQIQAEAEATKAAQQHAAEIDRLKASLTGYALSLDPVAASLAKVEQAERELLALRRAGVEASPAQTAAVVRMREKHEEMAAAANKASGYIKLQAHEVTNLTYQLQDAIVQLAGGQNPFLIMIQQGPQATGAVGGTANAIKLIRQEITPTRVAVVGFTAIMGALMLAANAQEGAFGGLRSQLRSVTTDYASAAKEVENMARRITQAGLGISRQEARDGVVSLMQAAPRGSSLDFETLAKDAADLAAVLKTDAAGGFDTLGRAMRDPAALVQELADRRFPGMTRELLGTVEALVAGGQKGDAFTLVLGRLRPQISGAATDVSPLTSKIRELTSAWDGFVEKAASGLGGAGIAILNDLRDLLGLVERVVKLAGQIPGLRQFAEIASAGPIEAGLAARRSLGLGEEGATNRALGQLGAGVYGPALPSSVATQRTSVPFSVPADLRPYFAQASVESNVDAELLARVFAREGVRNRDGSWRDSSVGAIGPMQVMPGTFAEMASRYGIDGTARDDGANIRAAARYLSELIAKFPNDLPRAIAAYNAGPNREGLGSPALGGTYARRALDGYSGSGRVTIQADTAQISGGDSATLRLPAVDVEASRDVTLERALMLARGDTADARPAPYASREEQTRFYQGAMADIAKGMQTPGIDARSLDILTNGYRNMAKAVEAAKGPQEQFLEDLGRSAEAARTYDPVQRAVNDAVTQYEERMRAAGEVPTDEGRNAARALKLQELGAAYTGASRDAQRANEAQDRIGAAWGRGQQAVQRLIAEEKAREVVRASGIQGEQAQEAAVQKLADAYEGLAAKTADNALRAQNDQAQENLDYLEKERSLIAATADERERELAAFRARQQAIRSGARNGDAIAEAERLARATADAQRETKQLQNSWDAVGGFVTDTASTIKNSIVSAIAAGEARAINFGNVWKAVKASALASLAELGAINPALNWAMGGVRPTLGGALSAAGAATGGGGGGGGGGGLLSGSGIIGQIGGLSSISSALGLGSISEMLGLGSLAGAGGLSGIMSMGLWGGTTAAYGSGAAALGGAMNSGAAMAGTTSAAAGTTLGGALAGVGGGFAIGTLLNQLVGGKAMGGMIGAGAGAGLGLLVGGPIGALIGGGAGGLLGGLFGPGKPNPAASVQYGVNSDGQLTVTGSKSKWMDDGEAIGAMQEALVKLNTTINGLGLSIDASVTGQTHFGKDSRPEEDQRNMTLAILEGLRGGSDAMRQVIQKELGRAYEGDDNLERSLAAVQWVKDIYDPLTGAAQAGSALQQQIDALSTSWEENIAKARELGLATDVLSFKQAEAIEAAKKAVRDTYDAVLREMDGRGYLGQVTAVRSSYSENAENFRTAGRDPEALFDRQMRAVLNGFSAAQLREVVESFRGVDDAAVALAEQLLATGSAAQKAANAALKASYDQAMREMDGRSYITGVEAVRANWTANGDAMRQAGLDPEKLFDRQMRAVLDQLNVEQLRDVMASFQGIDDAAVSLAEQMLRLGNTTTKAAEAAELATRQQLGGSIRSYVDGMRATAAGGATPQQQLQAAQDQFARDLALARGGDADASGRITGTADNLIAALTQMFGSTAEGRQGKEWVLSQLEQLPATKSYDALILAELQKLGGKVDVSVELTTFRVITETLNALADADRAKLVQAETVLRMVEDRLGRVLSTAERSRLIEGEVVLRSVEQSLGRNLTAAERASLVSSGDVLRAIEQRIGRQLTAAEAAGLVQSGTITRQVQELLGRGLTAAEAASLTAGGAVLRSVQEALGRSLSAAETASLVQGETVRRLVEQTMGRSLTAAERDGLVQAGAVIRSVEQQLGRSLTEAERGTLLASITVTRTVDQVIGRTLTAAELATFERSQTVLRRVEETLGRTLTAAERAALMQSTSIDRVVRETLGRTLTAAEDASLAKAGAVVRTVEQRLGRALTEAERASLVATATVTRTVQQAMGHSLTAAERAGLVASEDVLRRVEQTLGRNLTAGEKAELVAGGTVSRAVEQRLGATLTAAERASLVQGGSVLRSVEQALGRQLTAAETATLIPAGTVDRTVMQQVRALTASQLTQLVNSEAVVRTVEQQLGRTLTAAERAQLLETATLRRTIDEALGRTLTAAEKASLAQATTVIRNVEERLGRTLTAAEDASLVEAGTVVRQIQQQLGRDLTAAERASLVATATVERDIAQRLARDLTQTERAGLVASEDVLRRIEQSLGRNLTAAEKAELVAGGTVSRAVEQRLGATLTSAERDSLVQGGSVLRSIEQAIGRQLTAAETAALIPAGTVDRTVVQMVQTLTSTQRAKLVGGETVTRQIEQALGRTLTAAERALLIDSATVRREVTEALGARLTAAEKASLAQGGTILQSIEQQLGRQLTAAEQQTILTSGTVTRTVDQKVETTETVLISRSIDDKIGASLRAQTDLLAAMKASAGTQTITLAVLDGRLRNIDSHLYLLREMARGGWGGIRVTTPKASGAVNDQAFGTVIGNWGTTLTVNAAGNAFAGGNVIPFARGGVPMVDQATLFPMAGGKLGLLGEAGPEAILPLARMANGDLGVQAELGFPDQIEEEAGPVAPGQLPSPAPMRAGGSESVAELKEELRALRRELAELRAERREDARTAQKTAERTADAAEDTADSNRRMARKREPLMQRGGTK